MQVPITFNFMLYTAFHAQSFAKQYHFRWRCNIIENKYESYPPHIHYKISLSTLFCIGTCRYSIYKAQLHKFLMNVSTYSYAGCSDLGVVGSNFEFRTLFSSHLLVNKKKVFWIRKKICSEFCKAMRRAINIFSGYFFFSAETLWIK